MYSRKKAVEEIIEEPTAVWECTKEGCKGWMRDSFAFEEVPTCRQCQSPMVSATRMLPVIASPRDQKMLKKGVRISPSS